MTMDYSDTLKALSCYIQILTEKDKTSSCIIRKSLEQFVIQSYQ